MVFEKLQEIFANQFGVDKDLLMVYNGMSSYKTTRRQKVRIPLHPERVVIPDGGIFPPDGDEASDAGEQHPSGEEESAAEEEPSFDYSLSSLFTRKNGFSERIKVDVILPLNASGKPSSSAFDLYSGILLAVRDLAETGIYADLKVIDKAAAAISAEDLGDPDIILGPVAPKDLQDVLAVCDSTTAVVSLLDH